MPGDPRHRRRRGRRRRRLRRLDQQRVVGLAKDATILPARLVGREDQDADRVPQIAEGIRWAADNGAKVMNLSLSTPSDPPAINAAIQYALSKDVVIVASAGNRATASETADGSREAADPRRGRRAGARR